MFKSLVILIILSSSLTAMAKVTVVPGEFIVKVRRGVATKQAFSSMAVKQVSQAAKRIEGSKGRLVRVKLKKSAIKNGAQVLASNHMFEYIEPVYRISTPKIQSHGGTRNTLVPADKMFKKLWGLNNKNGFDVDALEAWKLTKGSKKVVVAVIDTGVDYNHPDLKGNMWVNSAELNGKEGVDDDGNGYIDDIHGYDFAGNKGDPMDNQGHGTHCAGTIGAVHNSIGVAGVAANVRLMALKFLGDNGGTTADAIEAIYYAVDNGAHVLSNSWGGGGRSRALKEAIEYSNTKGTIFTVAAGNDNKNNDLSPTFPSNYEVDNLISVAAYAEDGERAYVIRGGRKIVFSNYGKKTTHVSAPGSEILSTVPKGGYEAYSGTSMATPHVSGVIALLLSLNSKEWVNKKGEARNLDISPKAVRDLVIKTSIQENSLSEMTQSGGRVSAANLLKAAVKSLRR